jgi:threonylcarbamoyladenosine tRNA methylthiotransferase MtaB
METYNFLNELPISYLHVFTYSERANTTAVKLGDPVPKNIRKERSKKLQILSHKKKRAFYEENKGKEVDVLFENENNEGYMYGFSSNYVKVKAPFDENLTNSIVNVSLEELDRDGIYKVTF